ncbi:U4/U6.U5 tri-snRNP-associated protein 1, partial [Tremellales sp. Uapishka_1]
MDGQKESLTLEETNKVRISLGLAPIGVAVEGEDVPVDEDAAAEANFEQRRQEMKKEREERDLKERIAKARNKTDLNKTMKGSTLGSTSKEDADLSAKNWIKKQKRRAKEREKELALKRQKDMEEADQAVYDENDLTGIKVAHGADDFQEGEEIILTLKDGKVLDGEEDELQNVNLIEDEALKAAKERKRKAAAAYTGFDDDEFDEDRIGKKAEVLSKYDDDFATGKVKNEGFRLGGPVEKKMKITDEDTEMIGQPMAKVKLNLDYTKEFDVSDYMKEGDAGFKKPKKKKAKRSTRKAEGDDEVDPNAMDVDGPVFMRREVGDGPDNLVDDDDLQNALSRARRESAKKRNKVKVEDIAAQIAQRKEEEDAVPDTTEEDGRITFDDTSEFVRNVNLQSVAAPVKRERAASPQAAVPVVVKVERTDVQDEDEEMESDDEDEALAEMAAREGMSVEEMRLKIDASLQEASAVKAEDAEEAEEAAAAGNGLGGILAMLKQQGAIKVRTAEEEERERVQKQRDLWLADHRRRMAQRELEKIQNRGGNKDQAQREWENRMREQQEAKDALESFKHYKPDINIVYHDEFGRTMTPKEAWKSLSHKFHGKTSGRMKTEKRLKKIAEERKQLTMSATDTPLGMSDAFTRRQVKTGEAHMVLSVGNKGSVQMADGKGKGKGKGRA